MDNIEKLFTLKVGDIRKLLADWDADLVLDDIIDRLDVDRYFVEDEYYDEDWDDEEDEDEDEDFWDDDDDDDWYEDDDEEDEDEEDYSLNTSNTDDIVANIARDICNGEYTLSSIRYLYSPEIIARIKDLI